MTPNNKNGHFNTLRQGATRNYLYARLYYDRTSVVFNNYLWVLSFRAQVSSNKLLPSEEMSLGGYSSIRGYKWENAVCATKLLKKKKDSLAFAKTKNYSHIAWNALIKKKNKIQNNKTKF